MGTAAHGVGDAFAARRAQWHAQAQQWHDEDAHYARKFGGDAGSGDESDAGGSHASAGSGSGSNTDCSEWSTPVPLSMKLPRTPRLRAQAMLLANRTAPVPMSMPQHTRPDEEQGSTRPRASSRDGTYEGSMYVCMCGCRLLGFVNLSPDACATPHSYGSRATTSLPGGAGDSDEGRVSPRETLAAERAARLQGVNGGGRSLPRASDDTDDHPDGVANPVALTTPPSSRAKFARRRQRRRTASGDSPGDVGRDSGVNVTIKRWRLFRDARKDRQRPSLTQAAHDLGWSDAGSLSDSERGLDFQDDGGASYSDSSSGSSLRGFGRLGRGSGSQQPTRKLSPLWRVFLAEVVAVR